MISLMRTTVDIDEDVLQAAKEIGRRRGLTAGRVISDLLREALAPRGTRPAARNGVPLLPPRPPGAPPLTMKTVNDLRDE